MCRQKERGERLAGGGEPPFGGRDVLCNLVNHRVVGVAYHVGCEVGGFFLAAGFDIYRLAVPSKVITSTWYSFMQLEREVVLAAKFIICVIAVRF